VSLGHARLIDYSFRFATHADVVKCKGSFTEGVIWKITDDCLKSLDLLEGFPYYYNRRALRVAYKDRVITALTYFMQPGNLDNLPGQGYFSMVREGYEEHGVPTEQLFNNVYESTTFVKG
jgi:gamma-glutamylcyclotransferase (GGCT)/AIG2-like uncharacterized protein YtfP